MALVDCPKGVWTKVADSVTKGFIHTSVTDPTVFYHAWRHAGDSAPPSEYPFSIDGQVRLTVPVDEIRSDAPIDVYIYARDRDGSVRVDA